MEILSFAETALQPKVDLVKGHVPFADMGAALSQKYGNPDFADSFLRYEYAEFGEFEIDVSNPMGVDENGEIVPVEELMDEQGNPIEQANEPQLEKLKVLLNRKPTNANVEPVTVLYYGNYSVPQA